MPIEINGTGSIVGVDSLSTPAVTNAAGSASAPSITFTGDSNTGIYSPAADTIAFTEGGVESVRIDSSGRVGIGTSSAGARLHVRSSADDSTPVIRAQSNNQTQHVDLGFYYINYDNGATSSPLEFQIDGSTKMALSATGLGIGTTSAGGILHTLTTGSDNVNFFERASGAKFGIYNSSVNSYIGTFSNHDLRLATNDTERARIDTSGRLLVGTSSRLISDERNRLSVDSGSGTFVSASFKNDAGANANTVDIWNAATSGNNNFITFFTEASSTSRGSIDYNRSAGQVRYNVTSDRRLKSEIQPAGTALTALASIQVRSYKWTETGYQVEHGFIAQELNGVVPDAVKTGDDNDEVTETWAVDNAKLVPLLTKALQEALEKIETLETKVAALESA